MEENLIAIRDLKTFCFNFDLPKDIDKNLKHEVEFILNSNKSLAQNKIKREIEQLLIEYKHGKIFMNTENSRMNEPHKFVLALPQRSDLKS